MKAIEIREFGGLDVLNYTDVPVPSPAPGQVLVRVRASGVGPWDAWIREGRSALPQPLPLIPGSDVSGLIETIGPGVSGFAPGQSVYGVTNPRFTGGYAGFAIVEASMIAPKPVRLTDAEAASVPVIATTAWQMLFDHARLQPNQRVLILGGGGNVGAYAVRLAAWARADVVATASAAADTFVRSLGARAVIDGRGGGLSRLPAPFDVVIDTVASRCSGNPIGCCGREAPSSLLLRCRTSLSRPITTCGLNLSWSLLTHRASRGLRPCSATARCRRVSARPCHCLRRVQRTRCWPVARTSLERSSCCPGHEGS
jgi:NADPH:quinone reductase-like Zn-dependent oxidoreductase